MALFLMSLVMLAGPAFAEMNPATGLEVDCSVWTGVDCGALESSIRNGDGQFSQTNVDECRFCNPKKKGFFQ